MSGAMTRGARGLVLALAAWATVSAAAPSARAGAAEEAKSRDLFKQAESLANDGRWKEACHLYQAAHDLNGTGGTALRTADCYEKIAQYEQALGLYQWVVDHRATDRLPDRVKLAEGRVSALRKQLGKDVVQKTPQGPVQQTPAQVPSTSPTSPTSPPPPPPPPPPPNRVPAIVVASVGGAGLVAGAVLGGLALAQSADIKSMCGDGTSCKPVHASYSKAQFDSDTSAMNAKGLGSTIALGVGAAAVVTGVVLFVLKVPKASSVAKTALGPSGLMLRF
jgi:hypothetical protein